MNANNDFLGNELRRAADTMPPASLSLDDVKRRATSHQRRTVALATAAAVIVIAAPIAAINVFNGDGNDPQVAGSPTPSVTQGPVGEVILDFGDAPLDTAPKVPIYFKGLLAETPIDLESGYRLQTFAPYGGGWIALVSDDQGILNTVVLDSEGNETDSWPSDSWTLARGADGSVAFINADGDLELADPSGTTLETWDLAGREQVQPIALVGDGSVAIEEAQQVNRALLAHAGGGIDPIVDGMLTVGGTSTTGQVAGITSITDEGSCGEVAEIATGEPLWQTCSFTLDKFNASSTLILGLPSYRDGIGDNSVSILDAQTGETLVDYRFDNHPDGPWGFINQSVWEDETHVLAQAWSSEYGWRILRLGVDGTVTVADLGNLGRNEMNAPVRFIAQP
jgi:hypothetical protein